MDVSFVDDVAIPVTSHASDIINKSATVVTCVLHAFRSFGMAPNGIVGFFQVALLLHAVIEVSPTGGGAHHLTLLHLSLTLTLCRS